MEQLKPLVPNFQLGDVVKMKGQPVRMTITKFNYFDSTIECAWFVDSYLNVGFFHQQTLEYADG